VITSPKYFVAANDPDLLRFSQHENDVDFLIGTSKQVEFSFSNANHEPTYQFYQLIELTNLKEEKRYDSHEITKQTYEMLKCRLNGYLLKFFRTEKVQNINYQKISAFIQYLQAQKIGMVTINQYIGLLKRVLYAGVLDGIVEQMPIFPKVKSKSIPRGSFSAHEYRRLLRISKELSNLRDQIKPPTHRNTANGAFVKRNGIPKEMPWLIGFMVNTFIRPVDIKLIKHKHIQVIDGMTRYLRISMIETKKHTGQIVSMRTAVSIYKKILIYQASKGYGDLEDYVFFPEVTDRQSAIALISGHFRKVLDHGKMNVGVNGEKRSLYSLRHTAITFRLLYGKGIDLLTLARNARTSVEMIERFYSSNLTAEMNIDMLQSKRTRVLEKKLQA
jgi:Phage integrase SAM-like domain